MGLDGHKGLQDPSQVAFDSLILCYMTPQGAGGLLALLWVKTRTIDVLSCSLKTATRY